MKRIIAPMFGVVMAAVSTAGMAELTTQDTAASTRIQDSLERMNAERITHAEQEPNNWLTHGRTYREERFSPLNQINDKTVKNLGLAWSWDTDTTRGLEASPIVVDGVMYTTGNFGVVYALDARTGKLIWKNDLDIDRSRGVFACCDAVNRGVAVWKGKVYVGTLDGRLVALDAVTGKVVWDVLTIDKSRPYTITGAPRIIKGKVLIGNGGAEYGVRGYITAYDAETGQQLWRFYTVPGDPAKGFENKAMEMAAKTWGGGPWWEIGGGGTVWDSMAYDPDLDLLYIGVGNGSPWNKYIRSPAGGDNLFLSSIVALKPDTGEYVWHYQTTPGEGWDYTATQHIILADLTIAGQKRKVLMQAPKNGFFYVIDRETGKFISANNYVPVTWASHIDSKTGRPVQTKNDYKQWFKFQYPSPFGGHNWMPMSYDPQTGLVYIPSQEVPFVYADDQDFKYRPGHWNTGTMQESGKIAVPGFVDPQMLVKMGPVAAEGYLQAWDPIKQKAVWKVSMRGPWNGGVLSTAGNLVFQGNGAGRFVAYAADTGKKLWDFDAQTGIIAPPVTYEIDGEQYVTVMAGWGGSLAVSGGIMTNAPDQRFPGRILTFKLDGRAALPPLKVHKLLPQPPALTASSEEILKGNKLFHTYCMVCHGPGAVSRSGIPDLRYMQAKTHEDFIAIVLGGLRANKGMVSFADVLSFDDTQAIHAYLIEQGQQALEAEQQSSLWRQIKNGVYSVFAAISHAFIRLVIWLTNAA